MVKEGKRGMIFEEVSAQVANSCAPRVVGEENALGVGTRD